MKILSYFFALFLAYCIAFPTQASWAVSNGTPITVQATVTDESCPNSGDGSIVLSILTGTPPYTIQWSTGDAIPNLLGLTNGTYSVSITDSLGCTYLDTFQVGFQTSFPFVSAGNNQTICGGQVQLNGNNPAPGTGVWQVLAGAGSIANPNSPQAQVMGMSSGINQFVWVVTEGNCSRADTVEILSQALPVASAGADTLVCDNSYTLNGTVQGMATGTWTTLSPGVAFNNSASPQALATNLSPGPNWLLWTASNGTCSLSDSVLVFLQPPPVANFSSTSTNLTAQFLDLSSDANTWLWDFGDTQTSTMPNPTHNYSGSGSYQVCLSTANQCGIDSSCSIVEITCPPSQVSFQSIDTFLTITLNNTSQSGLGNATYLWYFGDGDSSTAVSPSHTYAQPGTYLVCLTLTDSCSSKDFCDSVTVNCIRGTSGFTYLPGTVGIDFFNASNSIDSNATYLWEFGDGDTSTQANPSHVFPGFGFWDVCLILTDACGTDTSCQTVLYEPLVARENALEMELKLWPQPAQNVLHIELSTNLMEILPISLWDGKGQMVWQGELEIVSGMANGSIDLNALPKGVYWLRLEGNQPIMKTVLKQ